MDPSSEPDNIVQTTGDQTKVHVLSHDRRQTDVQQRPGDSSFQIPDHEGTRAVTSLSSALSSLEYSSQAVKDDRAADDLPGEMGARNATPVSASTPAAYDGLFSLERSDVDRSALFEDAPTNSRDIPGTLHLQSNENIKHLISRTGAVALVKQMSVDLAQRDAHVTLLQRRAEEREALLRRMLTECEISNLNIENRLKELERSTRNAQSSLRASNLGIASDASVEDRISLAIHDEHHMQDGSTERSSIQSRTIGATKDHLSQTRREADSPAAKGWKGYFAGSGANKQHAATHSTARSDQNAGSSGDIARPSSSRKPSSTAPSVSRLSLRRESSTAASINEDGAQASARRPSVAGSDSAVSSRSITGWALRLVAGNSQNNKISVPNNVNGIAGSNRASATEGSTLSPTNSTPDVVTRNAAIRRVNASHSVSIRSSLSNIDLNTSVRKGPFDSSRDSIKDSVLSTSPVDSADGATGNIGPVEMDTILPEGSGPPTLPQNALNSALDDILTDSFGFIYDQRRRRRQEAAMALPRNKHGSLVEPIHNHRSIGSNDLDEIETSSSDNRTGLVKVNSRSDVVSPTHSKASEVPKRWQDYLKLATFTTELLSHTPSVGPITDITTEEIEDPMVDDGQANKQTSKRGSMPALGQVPTPSASRVVSENAELVTPNSSNPTSPSVESELEINPVQALVEHLTEVHEAAQREKAIKWNDFLRKVRADRGRDASKAAQENRSKNSMPETLLADGELIGIAGLGVKGKFGRTKRNEFRTLILGGIPTAYRAKIWAEGSGATTLRIPGYYEELTKSEFNDVAIVQQIQMDITRTLTDNVYYRRGAGVDKLNEVLLAYARRNPDIGYCQGMNLIAANLLLIMPTAEDAFWVLTSMIENILPEKYYDSSLLTSRADQVVLRQCVSEILPQLSAHLEELRVELEALTFQWFLSVFTDCLSAEALFRVWDVVLCLGEGATFLFQVALALLKLNEKSLLKCSSPAEVYGYINQGMTDHAISIDNLIRASEGLKKEVRTEDILKRREEAVAHELEISRQRDAIRKGKAKAKTVNSPARSSSSVPLSATSEREPARLTAADGIAKARTGKLTRNDSRGDFDQEARQALGELEVRTPMPIDEEVMWRG